MRDRAVRGVCNNIVLAVKWGLAVRWGLAVIWVCSDMGLSVRGLCRAVAKPVGVGGTM